MKHYVLPRYRAWLLEVLAWLTFYLAVHFNANDEQYSFWLPMKFIVTVPQVLCAIVSVYSFSWLFARPLEVPLGRLLLYAVGSFVLLHVVYYYAMRAAQPWAPMHSVTYRRWANTMAPQGPFYFLRNAHYLLTVSPFLFSSQLCLPLGVKLLRDTWRENQHLAAAQRQQQAWELAAVRSRLNPTFFHQTLGHISHLLDQQQAATAAEVALKLAQVLRYTLYEARAAYVPLQDELNALLDYVQLQELRLQAQVEVSLHLTVSQAEQQTIRGGLLLPLVEQWLALATTAFDLDLRVQGAELTLDLRAEGVPGPSQPVAPVVAAHLAHHTPGHQVTYQLLDNVHVLTLRLPLGPSPEPVASQSAAQVTVT